MQKKYFCNRYFLLDAIVQKTHTYTTGILIKERLDYLELHRFDIKTSQSSKQELSSFHQRKRHQSMSKRALCINNA